MFKIGDFSKLSRVSVKTLRYYDEIGLLKPHGIDRFTRYRFYSAEQLPVLYRILGLKDLGFSLEQIARLLEGDLTPDQLHRMLQKRQAEIEMELAAAQEQLAQVQARLRQIKQEGCLPHYEVLIKQVDAQWVAAVDGLLPGYDQAEAVFSHLIALLFAWLEQRDVTPAGPLVALYHEAASPDECTRVEVAAPLARRLPGSEGVRVYELTALECAASVVHQGSYLHLGDAYQAVLSWVQSNGYQLAGLARELYLSPPQMSDPNRSITEIQIPVKKIRKESYAMQPKIVTLDKFYAVGMPYLGKNEHGEITRLWDEFMPRFPEVKQLKPGAEVSYGICSPNPEGLIDYIAALPVAELSDIPEGMVGKEVPAQTYVVFESHGIEEIGPTYQTILKEWLPNSGYQPGDGPDFEYYTSEFNPEDPESVLYIYFPIKK